MARTFICLVLSVFCPMSTVCCGGAVDGEEYAN